MLGAPRVDDCTAWLAAMVHARTATACPSPPRPIVECPHPVHERALLISIRMRALGPSAALMRARVHDAATPPAPACLALLREALRCGAGGPLTVDAGGWMWAHRG